MKIDKSIERASWLSLSLGLLGISNAILAPLLVPLNLQIKDWPSNIIRLSIALIILYSGYISYKFFKNKNKWLYYNSIFILATGAYELILFVLFWFSISFFGSGKNITINIVTTIVIQSIYGLTYSINGFKLLEHTKKERIYFMRTTSYYLLLATLVLFSIGIISILIEANTQPIVKVPTPYQNQIIDNKTSAPYHYVILRDTTINYISDLFGVLSAFTLTIGLSMFIMSFIAKYYLKKLILK